VLITDRGTPRHILMAIEDYYRLTGGASIVDLLSMPETDQIDFEPPRVDGAVRPATCSNSKKSAQHPHASSAREALAR